MYRLLSHPLDATTPLYGDTPQVTFSDLRNMKNGDTSNSTLVSFCTHSGTHIDVPLHFALDGRSITDFKIEEFIFSAPLLIDCPKSASELVTFDDIERHGKELSVSDMLLLRTGFSRLRGQEIYRTQNPGICPTLAQQVMDHYPTIRAVGIDSISVSSYQNREVGRRTHQIFLNGDRPMILIEDLCLEDLSTLQKLFVIPLMLNGLDGSPVTVFAKV